jgi:hypothetical protein
MGREGTGSGSMSRARTNRRPTLPNSGGGPGPVSSEMGREASMGIATPVRRSLATTPPAPSPLSSQLTTITSAQPEIPPSPEKNEMVVELEVVAISIGMTRSNSLPVLTLRELEAIKQKDAELGIARGSDWAWVGSEEEGESINSEEIETPALTETPIPPPPNSLKRHDFAFNDPFSSTRDGTFRRTEETARFGSYRPIATLAVDGYHYSPSAIPRRGSDIPTPSSYDPLHRNSTAGPSKNGPSSPMAKGMESPKGTPLPAPIRPKLTRYRTSPALSEGLGLALVVKADPAPTGSINLSTVERRERRHAQLRDEAQDPIGEFGQRRGSWAPVDIVDGLEMRGLVSVLPVVMGSGNRTPSISSLSSRGSFTFPRIALSNTSARRISVGGPTSPTSRKESYDPSISPTSTRAAALFDGSEYTSSPRRASVSTAQLARVSQSGGVLGVWKIRKGSAEALRRGSAGTALVTEPAGDWHERRGSWAEGWKRD